MQNHSEHLHPDPAIAARQRWMGILARARREELAAHAGELCAGPYEILRAPETGMIMTRGRLGGTGNAFNLGEMTVTRCVVRLKDGRMGHAWRAGRDKRATELAALADAHLQGEARSRWLSALIAPLEAAQQARQAAAAADTAATRVDFFTLVRGES